AAAFRLPPCAKATNACNCLLSIGPSPCLAPTRPARARTALGHRSSQGDEQADPQQREIAPLAHEPLLNCEQLVARRDHRQEIGESLRVAGGGLLLGLRQQVAPALEIPDQLALPVLGENAFLDLRDGGQKRARKHSAPLLPPSDGEARFLAAPA